MQLLLQLLVAMASLGCHDQTVFSCETSRSTSTFGFLSIAPNPGINASIATVSTVTPSDSLSQCLQLCALNRHKKHCKSVCRLPNGLCLMYNVSDISHSYLPNGCELMKLYRTDEFPDCRVRWIGSRRFCLLQQRLSASVNFSRTWLDYETGFGDADNFWTGLKQLHRLTTYGDTGNNGAGATVRFELTKWDGSQFHCEYDGFQVGNSSTNYLLSYSRYATERSNIATDGLAERSRGMMFSTMDRDNDQASSFSCSINYASASGWWFKSCFYTNPNGLFVSGEIRHHKYITWYAIDNAFVSLKSIRMMILVE